MIKLLAYACRLAVPVENVLNLVKKLISHMLATAPNLSGEAGAMISSLWYRKQLRLFYALVVSKSGSENGKRPVITFYINIEEESLCFGRTIGHVTLPSQITATG